MHPAVINASQLITVGDITGAEKVLSDIADQHGDTALMQILDEVAPKDLLAIMREYDSAKQSLLSMMVTPEQFARAVVLDKQYGERNKDKMRGMINAVIYKDPDLTGDYLEAMFEQDGGTETMADYFYGRLEEVFNFVMHASNTTDPLPFLSDDGSSTSDEIREFFAVFHSLEHIQDKTNWSYTRSEVADNDWKETIWILFHEQTDFFEHIIGELQGRVLAHAMRAERRSKPISDSAIESLLAAISGGSDKTDEAEESAI
ncbi:hypothetical protein K4H28_00225 [Deefgea tanakiae]|uniref:Flagellar motor switch protein FliG n=1 Tax=Deefgea tanakiae TaxID=2865840 RepID=A0ABX8Z696_9NEIS|nr:hypothetical protein [Deefgea tanakiae]QZA77905.1 hypothetical protein K4H28_00225 [Deefgea tanakiae]